MTDRWTDRIVRKNHNRGKVEQAAYCLTWLRASAKSVVLSLNAPNLPPGLHSQTLLGEPMTLPKFCDPGASCFQHLYAALTLWPSILTSVDATALLDIFIDYSIVEKTFIVLPYFSTV